MFDLSVVDENNRWIVDFLFCSNPKTDQLALTEAKLAIDWWE